VQSDNKRGGQFSAIKKIKKSKSTIKERPFDGIVGDTPPIKEQPFDVKNTRKETKCREEDRE